MVQLNIKNITNQYLYGQLTTPTNLADDSLIRPKDATTTVEVGVVASLGQRVLADLLLEVSLLSYLKSTLSGV